MARKSRSKPKPNGVEHPPAVKPSLPSVVDEPPKRMKESLRLLQRAVSEGWQIPSTVWSSAPDICTRILADENATPRDRLRATEVLAAMARDKVNAAIALDKIERLEGGDATERVVITPEIRARAEEIIRRRFGNAG